MNILVGAARSRSGRALAMASALMLGACSLDGEGTAILPDAETPLSPEGDGLSAPDDAAEPSARRDAGQYVPDLPVPSFDAGFVPDPGPGDADTSDDEGPVEPPAPDAGDAGTKLPERRDLGRGDGKDVVTLGDSWMAYSFVGGIQAALVKVSKQPYRRYGLPGARVLSGDIPNQYQLARSLGVVRTVVMTGGGGDLIGANAPGDCDMGGPACRLQIDRILERLDVLWTQMSNDGVENVIYVGYSRGPGDMGVDYGTIRGKSHCDQARLRCHWLDSDKVINHELRQDKIHPTDPGFEKLGQAIYDLMEAEGMRR